MIQLPQRDGERPKTHYGLPHEQLTQNAPPEMYERLKDRAWGFEFVERRASVISVPGAEGLWLADEGGHGCAEAFMRGNEFAHVHPPHDGSMHMMLPEDQVREVLRKYLEDHPTLFVEDLWDYVDEPPSPRAVGAIIQGAARDGWIAHIRVPEYGKDAIVSRPSTRSNLAPKPVWRSLLYRR